MSEPLEVLIRYRLERAQESLDDARLLADAERWHTCVNRLYHSCFYARLLADAERWHTCVNRLYHSCFYAVSALLAHDGLSSARHTGIRSLFNRQYVQTNIVPRALARMYNDLFERRQEGDYADFVRFQPEQVRPWIPQTEAFIAHIASLLPPTQPLRVALLHLHYTPPMSSW